MKLTAVKLFELRSMSRYSRTIQRYINIKTERNTKALLCVLQKSETFTKLKLNVAHRNTNFIKQAASNSRIRTCDPNIRENQAPGPDL